MSYRGETRGSGGEGSVVLIKNKLTKKPPPKTTMCFLTEVKYTRFLFKHLTPISSSHLSLHVRSSCSLETKGREIGRLLVHVTKEMGLHKASGKDPCSRGVFSGLGESLPLALVTGDVKCAFYGRPRGPASCNDKATLLFFAKGKGFALLMLCHFHIREMGPGSVEGGVYQTAVALKERAALQPSLSRAPSLDCASGPFCPSRTSRPRLPANPAGLLKSLRI